MSASRRKPLATLPQAQTPTRYNPSTPHAIRALQQRSGAKTRSTRARKTAPETLRLDSARGILRRLAKITAPFTKKAAQTPVANDGKENVQPDAGEGEEDEHIAKKPRITFDIDESLDESIEEEPQGYDEEEEDSELLAAPTPSNLLEDEDGDVQPTMTFKSIDFARQTQAPASGRIDRRRSRPSTVTLGNADEEDDDPTMLTERGRRAVSEEATGRLSRYSFGSIRMSDFGSELEVRRQSDPKLQAQLEEMENTQHQRLPRLNSILDVTEDLSQLRRSISPPADDTVEFNPVMGDDFQLPMPEHETVEATSAPTQIMSNRRQIEVEPAAAEIDGASRQLQIEAQTEQAAHPKRRLTEIEEAGQEAVVNKRRKRQKMTRHGTLVPSLPSNLIKHIANEAQTRRGRRKPQLSKDHMKALEQATEWFFEQVGEDLASYAEHGRRKKRIDVADVQMLMRRQRVQQGDGDLRTLAKDWLPREVLERLDLPDEL